MNDASDVDLAIAAAQAGAAIVRSRYRSPLTRVDKLRADFATQVALCQVAGCVLTGLHGQPLHTGIGGLLVAADQSTHAELLDLIGRQFRPG